MIGKQYVVKVTYDRNPKLFVRKVFKPDFASALKDLHPPAGDKIVFTGKPGKEGLAGHEGKPGQEGRGSSAQHGHGGNGTRGEDGHPAWEGGQGGPGSVIRVTSTEVYALDGETRLILFSIKNDREKEGTFYLRPWDAPPLRIVAEGGKGGKGGKGGNGGASGEGGFGYNSGSGASGGNGGNGASGGPGGPGGPGGKVYLAASSKEILDHFILEAPGEQGGESGQAGEAGHGGKSGGVSGALIGAGAEVAAGLLNAFSGNYSSMAPASIPPQVGSAGDNGGEGYPGESGRDRAVGQVLVKVEKDIISAFMKELPSSIGDRLFLKNNSAQLSAGGDPEVK